jgi:thymidylate kinase
MESRLNSKPFFFSLEGTDGTGKTTTLNMLRDAGGFSDEPVLFLEKKSNVPAHDYPSTHLAALRDLIWNHPGDAPVHLLSEMHWMHLQAAWFHATSYSRIRPAIAAGTSVFADGWYYKFLARVALAPTLDYDRVAGFFDGVTEPDCVILLDADPELTSTRKRTFTEIEGGNLQGDMKASRQTFQQHQRALREKLLEMADLRGWHVLPVAEQTREQVCTQVLEVLAEWKRGRSGTLQPSL